jgi:hypothetical protein
MGDSITGTTDASGKPKSTRVVSAASTNATLVKPSAGALFGWLFYNTAAYDVFVKFYDKATAPVVGTDVPVLTVKVKAGDKDEYISVFGRTFANGIAYAITKLVADTDATATLANDLTGEIETL